MESLFTPGAQRALIEAAAWSSGVEPAELEAPALLLGLLAESECRAALLLSACGIDPEAVRRQWPSLERKMPVPEAAVDLDRPEELRKRLPRFADELLLAVAAVRRRLYDYPRPLVLATEHLLMGLAATGKEVSTWLGAHGIDADSLELEIHRRSGQRIVDVEKQTGCPGADPEVGADTDDEATQLTPREGLSAPRAQDRVAALRVVDAAANRAMEGLRVVEDHVRFVLDDRHLTDQLKRLRHDLSQALQPVSLADRLAARETRADVGTPLSTASEESRPALADVLAANFARVQEALRSLEEFGKLVDGHLGAQAKQLRYRVYTLQRAVQITASSLQRLGRARLYVLIDGGPSDEAFATLVRGLVRAGVDMIQLRDKRLADRPLLARARLLRELTTGTGTLCLVNDRPDLAVLAGADGVHVGQEELSVKDARALVGPAALVGVSTHSIQQARQAVFDGADYLGVGPTFPSGTKHFEQFPGLDLVRAVAAEIRLPAFAIGGIHAGNVSEVIAAGLRRIAVTGAVAAAPDPPAAARELLAALRSDE